MKNRAELQPPERRRFLRLAALVAIAFALLGVYLSTRQSRSATASGLRINELATRRDAAFREQRLRNEARANELEALVAEGDAAARHYAELASLLTEANPARAKSLLDTATQRFPKSVSLWAGLGQAHQREQRPDRAILAFRKANALDPVNPLVAAALSNLYMGLGWSNEARKVLIPALKKHPREPSVRMSLSRVERQSGNPRGSREAVEFLCSQPDAPALAHVLLAQAFEREGDRKRAAESFRNALSREPWNTEVRSQLAGALTSVGTREALSDAEGILREALEVQQSDPLLQRSLGNILARQGKHQEALDLLIPLSENGPDDSTGLTLLANSLRRLNRGSEALPYVKRARKALEQEGEFSRLMARAHFRPKDPDPPLALARIYLKQEREDLARAEVLRALQADPKHLPSRRLAQSLGVEAISSTQ